MSPSARREASLDIQISIEGEGWPDEAALQALAERVLSEAASHLQRVCGQPFGAEPLEVSLLFTDDETITGINAEWRRQNKPTNVLSFPAAPIAPGDTPFAMLGDIILARETIEREARDLEKSFDEHLTHLLVHGFLHLFGYDHLASDEAEKMEALETGILAALGLSDPYAGQDPV